MGFEDGCPSIGPLGEIWASWCIPSELVAADDLPGLCWRFAKRFERLEIPDLAEALGPLLAE